jgi:hypothetical protein
MQSVKSLAKAVSKEMADSLKGTEELLTLALTKAQKDNNTVYLERVPVFAGGRGPGLGRNALDCHRRLIACPLRVCGWTGMVQGVCVKRHTCLQWTGHRG